METLAPLLALFVVDLLAAITPGPNFFIVSASSARHGRAQGLSAVGGILAANAVWVIATLLGLSILFELVPWLYPLVKILGGVYLLYLSLQYWRAPVSKVNRQSAALARSSLLRGFLTGITNPKSLVYFGSIFTLFVGPSSPGWVVLAAGLIVLFNGALWYGSVALFFGSSLVQRAYRRIERPLNRVTAVVIGAFGARLILDRE